MPGEQIIPVEINLDVSRSHLGTDKSRFTRNIDFSQLTGTKDAGNTLVGKPLQEVFLYDPEFQLPAGKNFLVGKLDSHETNEVLCFAWNIGGVDTFYRIKDGRVEKIFQGPLTLSTDPEHFIGTGRIAVFPVCIGDDLRTFVVYTDSLNTQRMICIEDSIATDSFDPVKFPRFVSAYARDQLINLGVISPTDCIGIKAIAGKATDVNRLKYHTWQFRTSFIDVYGRPSEHGPISDLFYVNDCSAENITCLDLTFDAGNPLVEKVQVEFRSHCTGEWRKHITLELYDACDKPWYLRPRSSKINYNAQTNKITHRFCADGECPPVPDVETQRAENPLPLISESAFSIGGVLALAGNTYGRKPFDCALMDKIHFEVEKPDISQSQAANIITRNITAWIEVFNPYNRETQALWTDDQGSLVFGGIGSADRIETGVAGVYKQYFGDPEQGGFIGILSNDQTAVSVQHRFVSNDWVERGIVTDTNEIRANKWMQKLEFKNVPPGTYTLRLVGHRSRLTDPDYKKTSTYFIGTTPVFGNRIPNSDALKGDVRELTINVCEKDYDGIAANEIIQVWDLTEPHKDKNLRRETRVTAGYVYETRAGLVGVNPMAEQLVETNGNNSVYKTAYTDYNGFYFCSTKDMEHRVVVSAYHKCESGWIGTYRWNRDADSGLAEMNFYATDTHSDFTTFDCNRWRIKGKILDCETDAPLVGIIVAATRSQWTTSDQNGEFEIIRHSTYRPGDKSETVYFLAQGKCKMITCDDKICIPPKQVIEPPCTLGPPPLICGPRIITLVTLKLKSYTKQDRGLQLGGIYPFAVHGGDWMDRKNFRQTKKEWYLPIPTANEMGVIAYPRIKWRIDAGARFPSWMNRLYFSYGQNLAYSDFLTWVVDRFEFIDNSGIINTVSPRQIKIYYRSLNEYNKQHAFSTNATWQFIDEKNALTITDRVHFVANGDGSLFIKNIVELVRFDKDGGYFLVDYNTELRGLKAGALMKFMRQATCVNTDAFSELCESIRIIDGVPERTEGYLNCYDSYMLSRQVPTPITRTVKKKKAVANSNPITYEEVEEDITANSTINYAWPFEHHSPSDFWGEKCSNRGRIGVKNDMENVMCKISQIALSGAVGANGLVNYLHYFDEKRTLDIDTLEGGGIVAGIPQINKVLFVCETDHFLVPFDDNSIRLDPQTGRAVIVTADRQFGKPQRVDGQNYGCAKDFRNTITAKGIDKAMIVSWVDPTRVAHVVHNFKFAEDVANNRYATFLRAKIKSIRAYNVDSKMKRFMHQHINPKDGQIYATDFNMDNPTYITDEASPQIGRSESFCTDAIALALRKFVSFTPEGYASLPGDVNEQQFFSFKEGIPYAHYSPNPNPSGFNKFYGVECQRYIKPVFSGSDPFKVKEFKGIEIHTDDVKMFSPTDGVATSSGQLSWLPRNRVARGEKIFAATFICDKKTVGISGKNALYEGDHLRGKWVEILLIADPDHKTKYSEITGVIIFANGVEKTGT